MITKDEALQYVQEESHLDEVIKYLSNSELKLEELKDILNEVKEPENHPFLGVIPRNTYEYQVLNRIFNERAGLGKTAVISWVELCETFEETGHNYNKLL